jgi:hypothetical protein
MRARRGCVVRAITAYALFLVGVCLVWVLGGHLLASLRLRSEARAWSDSGFGMDALLRRFPKASANDAGLQMDRLCGRLGIHMVWHPERSSTIDDKPLYDALTAYADVLRASIDPAFPPPPAQVSSFLQTHRSHVDDVVQQLLLPDEIAWPTDLDTMPSPIPSLLSHRNLHLLLVVETIESLRRGDAARAHRTLSAAWRQRQDLCARPEIVSQLIGMTLAEEQTSVLRRWPDAPTEWKSRLTAGSFRARFLLGLQAETYSWLTLTRGHRGIADLEGKDPSPTLFRRTVRVATAPYVRLAMAGVSTRMRRVTALAAEDGGCALDGEALVTEALRDVARWNMMPKLVLPAVLRAWPSAIVADLDGELTSLTWEVPRLARDVPRGALPSRVCGGTAWTYRRAEGGRITIQLEGMPKSIDGPKRKNPLTAYIRSR